MAWFQVKFCKPVKEEVEKDLGLYMSSSSNSLHIQDGSNKLYTQMKNQLDTLSVYIYRYIYIYTYIYIHIHTYIHLLVNLSSTDESWEGRNMCMWIYTL